MTKSKLISSSLLMVALAACGIILPSPGLAAGKKAQVVSPGTRVHGKTMGEWSALWWQWALSVPADKNPVADETGEFGGVKQKGPVWFLGGTFGNSIERTVTVPHNRNIFFSINTWIFGAGVGDCSGSDCDVADLRARAAYNVGQAQEIQVTIDGVPLADPASHRTVSPKPFMVTVPEGAVFGLPSGRFFPHVTDGYWVMLSALAEGSHEIRIHFSATDTDFGTLEYDLVYHLVVVR